ncbi:hypothetical protein V2J09_000435 [Rumex salicifolius]
MVEFDRFNLPLPLLQAQSFKNLKLIWMESAKIQEYLYRHVASSNIPKQLHCLALGQAHEHMTNAGLAVELSLEVGNLFSIPVPIPIGN